MYHWVLGCCVQVFQMLFVWLLNEIVAIEWLLGARCIEVRINHVEINWMSKPP